MACSSWYKDVQGLQGKRIQSFQIGINKLKYLKVSRAAVTILHRLHHQSLAVLPAKKTPTALWTLTSHWQENPAGNCNTDAYHTLVSSTGVRTYRLTVPVTKPTGEDTQIPYLIDRIRLCCYLHTWHLGSQQGQATLGNWKEGKKTSKMIQKWAREASCLRLRSLGKAAEASKAISVLLESWCAMLLRHLFQGTDMRN